MTGHFAKEQLLTMLNMALGTETEICDMDNLKYIIKQYAFVSNLGCFRNASICRFWENFVDRIYISDTFTYFITD